jgi:hypothetical protein
LLLMMMLMLMLMLILMLQASLRAGDRQLGSKSSQGQARSGAVGVAPDHIVVLDYCLYTSVFSSAA